MNLPLGPNSHLVVQYCDLLKQAEPQDWVNWTDVALSHPLFSLVVEQSDPTADRVFEATDVRESTTMVEATLREESAALRATIEQRFASLGASDFAGTAHALVYTSVCSQLEGDAEVFALGQEGFFYPSTIVEPIVLPALHAVSGGPSRDQAHKVIAAVHESPDEAFELAASAMRWVFDAAREVATTTPDGTLKCVKAILVAPIAWVVGGVPGEAASALEQIPGITLETDQIRPLFTA